MQNHYNLLYREEEREMLPLCQAEGIGVIPWSPLARGRLTRPWDATTYRSDTDTIGVGLYAHDFGDRNVVEAVGAVAERRNVPRAQLTLAWVMRHPAVSAVIVGARTSQHLADALAAVRLVVTAEEAAALEAPYRPHPVVGITANPSGPGALHGGAST